eukprot:gene54516-74687_t
MHSGFHNLRSALPMNIKARHEKFKIFAGARPDIERIRAIWTECLEAYGGPYLFGEHPALADAMYAPVVHRFRTYEIPSGTPEVQGYTETMMTLPAFQQWTREDSSKTDTACAPARGSPQHQHIARAVWPSGFLDPDGLRTHLRTFSL